jgi:predicted TPR repeat methyltransferase
MSVFDKYYAQFYDMLYKDKDYESESNYIISLIKKYNPEANSILDLGCGTGRHAELFSNKGFIVLGVDQSKYMLNEAMNRKNNIWMVIAHLIPPKQTYKLSSILSL